MSCTPSQTTVVFFFFFNDTATTEIYTLSLHDALPISAPGRQQRGQRLRHHLQLRQPAAPGGDRKSTRLNSSHVRISYAVFCLKKKKRASSARRRARTTQGRCRRSSRTAPVSHTPTR